jgi:hypothetical protein
LLAQLLELTAQHAHLELLLPAAHFSDELLVLQRASLCQYVTNV